VQATPKSNYWCVDPSVHKSNFILIPQQIAKIPPLQPYGVNCGSDCPSAVAAYNKAIEDWAPSKSSADSPIKVVDCFTGFDTKADMADGVHPNFTPTGTQKLADCFYQPLANVLQGKA
jgi:hypothetical protein